MQSKIDKWSIISCLRTDNIENLKGLHQEYPKLFNIVMGNNAGYGEYPIHTAAQYGATKCLEYMHQNGGNINLK